MSTLDIMLDLETLGKSNSPVLVQLAAVSFRAEDGAVLDSFNRKISPQSCSRVGLSCRGEDDKGTTLDWWLTQDPAVFNKIVLEAFSKGEDVVLVLQDFSRWLLEQKKKHNATSIKVYGKGPAADCVWLRSAYDAAKLEAPWKYWDDACVRTYLDIGYRVFGIKAKDIPFEGNKHDAIDDCKYQIKCVSLVFNKIKNK